MLALVAQTALGHPPFGIAATLSVSWGDQKTCDLTIQLVGIRINTQDPVPDQRILVEVEDEFVDPIGNPVIDVTYSNATAAAGDPINFTQAYTVTRNTAAKRVGFSWWDNGTSGEASGFVVREIPAYCPDIQTESELDVILDCGKCSAPYEDLPSSVIGIFKSVRTVYALPANDTSGTTFGETVSGVFRAPRCGILKVTVDGVSDNPSGDENVRVFLESWNGLGTIAIVGTTYVKTLAKDDLYKFSVRAYKGDNPDVTLFFDWHTWRDDKPPGNEEDCLKRYRYQEGGSSGLKFQIQELAYKNVPVPAGTLPRLTGKKHHEGMTEWFEVDRPGCGPNGEILTESFVLPVNGDGRITDGHAFGWEKAGTTLIAPGPDGLVYEILGF